MQYENSEGITNGEGQIIENVMKKKDEEFEMIT